MDTIELKSSLKDLEIRLIEIRDGVFNLIAKEDRLKEIENDLTKEEVWSDLDLSQKIKISTYLNLSLKKFQIILFFWKSQLMNQINNQL